MPNISKKRNKEKQVVGLMIDIYCKKKHKTKKLCPQCQALKDYAYTRVDVCPFMETKTFCAHCKVHCYKRDMREMIREVMRFSGPRMLLHHPLLAISHLIETIKQKKRMEK